MRLRFLAISFILLCLIAVNCRAEVSFLQFPEQPSP